MGQGDLSRIRTNIGAFSALNTMNVINKALAKSQLQLATGRRINTAGDDPAGFAIAKELEGKAMRYGQALNNIGDGLNLLGTAETGMVDIRDILVDMSVKTIQAASDTLSSDDRNKIKAELVQLTAEIDDIVAQTQWRNTKLLNGGAAGLVNLWVGPETTVADNQMAMTISASVYDTNGLGVSVATVNAAVALAAGHTTGNGSVTGLDATTAWADTYTALSGHTELASGDYTIRIQKVSAASEFRINVWDDAGNQVYVDADNATGTAALAYTLVVTDTLHTTIDIGRGITLDLLSTFSDDTERTFDVEYTHSGHSVSDSTAAATYLNSIQSAMSTMSTHIGRVGAYQERLLIKEDSVASRETDVWAAYSRIMDANMAKTQLDVTKFTILQQSAVAGLAQANVAPSFILGLLGG